MPSRRRWFALGRGVWRARWSVVRLLVACFCLWSVGADAASRAARLALAELPGFDYVGEIRTLREAGRFDEAMLVADAGLRATSGEGARAILAEREATAAARDSVARRAGDALAGAITGKGESLEGLAGAVAADFFVVGDIRDLAIQGYRAAMGQETDEVIVLLSGVGLITTVAPAVDVAPGLLKALRRAGMMSDRLAASLVRALRAAAREAGDAKAARGPATEALARGLGDVEDLVKRAGAGPASSLLRHADTLDDAGVMRRFVAGPSATRGVGAVFALKATGREGVGLLRAAEDAPGLSVAARAAGQRRAQDAVLTAATRAEGGRAFLGSRAARALIRPHPAVGLTKGLWKGTLGDGLARLVERLDSRAWWIVPLLAAWCAFEVVLLWWRVRRVVKGS
jgi:hypothetical protein